MKFTHKGWFGICPIYLAAIDTQCPIIDARCFVFEPLLWVSEGVFCLCIWVMLAIDPGYEPNWPLWITGELK